MIDITNPPELLSIGRKGENIYRSVAFDCSEWFEDYPNGTITIVYKRPNGTAYPVVTAATSSPVTWNVSSTDTLYSGFGKVEARLISGSVIGKSCVIKVRVFDSITSDAAAPTDGAPDWITTASSLQSQIGDLDDLETSAKTNLVAAINEAAESGGSTANAVLYTAQTLTDSQKTQARTNIGAGTSSFDGAYSSLSGTPTIPTKTSELTNDSGFLTSHQSLAAYRTSAAQDVIDATKQDTISDLATIRSGAALGATAYQLPSGGITATDLASSVTAKLHTVRLDPDGNVYQIDSQPIAAQYDDELNDIAVTYQTKSITDSGSYFTTDTVEDALQQLGGAMSGKQATALTRTVTITVEQWLGGTSYDATVSGVTATNIVICDSSDTTVQCTAQDTNELTFTATATPTATVTVKVVILP